MSVWTNTKKQRRQAHLRVASLVESSEQVKIETTVLAELRKGLDSISEAMERGNNKVSGKKGGT